MAALGRLYVVAAGVAQEVRHAEPGPGADDADRPQLGQGQVRPGDWHQLVGRDTRHRVRVISMIFSKPNDKITVFADAFRLRDTEKDK
jgi:hypothetical protein